MWDLIRANRRRAALMMAFMAALLVAVGYAVGEILAPGFGRAGLALAVVLWVLLALTSFFGGRSILLAVSGARKIQKADHPVLWNTVEEMCIASGLARMPEVYILDDDAPNAFATGRGPDDAAVAVTAGLLERLNRDELQGVVAHELAHVRNRDVLYMTLVGVMMGAIVMLADIGARTLFWGGGRRRTSSRRGGGQGQLVVAVVALAAVVLAPILARLMYFALSRRREYLADACSALYTRYPEGLASALEKISRHPGRLRAANRATAPMYIVNPLAATDRGLADLSATHPPISERIRILRSLGGQTLSLGEYDAAFRRITGRPVGVVPPGLRAAPGAVARRDAALPDDRSRVQRVRLATDALWRARSYAFVSCPCGTTLKVPPEHAGRALTCPRCGREHTPRGESPAGGPPRQYSLR
jgi:heat shock protein HtpX